MRMCSLTHVHAPICVHSDTYPHIHCHTHAHTIIIHSPSNTSTRAHTCTGAHTYTCANALTNTRHTHTQSLMHTMAHTATHSPRRDRRCLAFSCSSSLCSAGVKYKEKAKTRLKLSLRNGKKILTDRVFSPGREQLVRANTGALVAH